VIDSLGEKSNRKEGNKSKTERKEESGNGISFQGRVDGGQEGGNELAEGVAEKKKYRGLTEIPIRRGEIEGKRKKTPSGKLY